MQYALENGMIDVAYVQDQIEMNKRKEILEKHPYKIWQGDNGYWYTYIFDPSKKNNRKMIKYKMRESLENKLVQYYSESEESKSSFRSVPARQAMSVRIPLYAFRRRLHS